MRYIAEKLLRVYPGEGRAVLAFSSFAALMHAGTTFGLTAADTMFLSRVGAEQLPTLYLVTPLIMLTYILASTWALARHSIAHVLWGALLLIGLTATLLGYQLSQDHLTADDAKLLAYACKLAAGVSYIALYTLFWNFADGFFHVQDAKRLYALFAGGAAAGGSIAGAATPYLLQHLSVPQLLFVWALLSALAIPLLFLIRRQFNPLDGEQLAGAQGSALSVWNEILATLLSHRLARTLALLLFTLMFATLICEYQYLAIFSQDRDEAALASLLGSLYAAASTANLLITTLLFPRLIARFGTTQLVLVQPIAYLITFAILLADPSPVAAGVAFFAYHALLTSIDYNNTNILLNALPPEKRKQLRTLLEGLCEPLATALAGGVLFVVVQQISLAYVSAIGLLAAALCLTLAFRVRSSYLPALLENLRATRSTTQHTSTVQLPAALDEGAQRDLFSLATTAPEKLSSSERVMLREVLRSTKSIRPALAAKRAQDKAAPLRGRLFALQCLSDRSPGTMEHIALELAAEEASGIEELSRGTAALTVKPALTWTETLELIGSGQLLRQKLSLSLASLCHGGFLSDHRTLREYLLGSRARERGSAYEVLEQAVPRDLRLTIITAARTIRRIERRMDSLPLESLPHTTIEQRPQTRITFPEPLTAALKRLEQCDPGAVLHLLRHPATRQLDAHLLAELAATAQRHTAQSFAALPYDGERALLVLSGSIHIDQEIYRAPSLLLHPPRSLDHASDDLRALTLSRSELLHALHSSFAAPSALLVHARNRTEVAV